MLARKSDGKGNLSQYWIDGKRNGSKLPVAHGKLMYMISPSVLRANNNVDPFGDPVLAYSYTATADSKYFRLDVMKANIVATTLVAGSNRQLDGGCLHR